MVKWTNEQQKAIDLRNHNILVSAAAGSGKTAVLVERIKQLIIEDEVSIDRFLIVTFTKAAASEMKEKLIKAITKEIKENPSKASFLKRQLDLMTTANISTFHAFALDVIRRYFYLTDIEPNFKIGDEGAVEIIKREVLDQLFDDMFEEANEDFINFLRCYGSDRNERNLKEMVLEFYTTVQSIPHPMEWLEDSINEVGLTGEAFYGSRLYSFIKDDILSDTKKAIECFQKAMDMAGDAGVESIYEKCQGDMEALDPAKAAASRGDIDAVGKILREFKPATMKARKPDQESYNVIKDALSLQRNYGKEIIKDLVEKYFTQDMDLYISEMEQMKGMASFIGELINEFHSRFRQAKKEKNIIDFNDIEHYAQEILENPEASQEYKNKFHYIFVDEYQDSNVMQDTLINLIKREDNLFVVGDIKQSIYKFRLAEPEIFQARYRAYADENDTVSDKIDLNKNFRSKKAVIETVNGVFSEIMDGYDDAARLYQGVSYDGPIDYKTELHVIDDQITEDMDLPEDLADMKSTQLEAYHVGETIKNVLGTTIYDAKKQCERTVTHKDIVILMRSAKNNAEIFQEVLKEMDIPAYVDDSSGYFDTVEIQVFLNLLTVIDNKQQDVPLLSVLHSAIFGFTMEELIRIRLENRKGSYFEALEAYAEQGMNSQLAEKVKGVFEKLDYYRSMAQALPLEEFVWKLMWETGYYTYCGALPAGRQRQANLKALADKARAFKNTGYGGIYGFLVYIRSIEQREIKTGQVKLVNENEDLVRIMTIHKSKGLEFPVVFVAGMGKRFNSSKSGKGFFGHKDFGIGMTNVNYKEHWHRKTLAQLCIEKKRQQEELDETIRILYVALTRAMDRLILVGTGKFLKDGELTGIKKPNSYMTYLLQLEDNKSFTRMIYDRTHFDMEVLDQNNDRKRVLRYIESLGAPEKNSEYEELDRKLSFQYEDMASLTKKSKYSVTEYSHKGTIYEDQKDQLKVPAFMRTDGEVSAARKGIVMHKVMEVIDFKEALAAVEAGREADYIDRQIDMMVEREFILPEEREYIEPENIMSFFKTDIGRRAALADQLFKEAEFNYLKDDEGTEVMVQGVIDCLFREGEKYVILDYKNSYVNPDNKEASLARLKETYTKQVELYKEAVELIKEAPVQETYLYLFSAGEFVDLAK